MTHIIVHLNLTRRNVHYVTLKMKHEEEVTRNLCKLEGGRTSPSNSNDMKCAVLQRTLNKWATEWAECRMGNIRGNICYGNPRLKSSQKICFQFRRRHDIKASQRECQAGIDGDRSSRQTILRGDGNWIEKGRLVHMTNRSLNTPHACTCTVNRLWRGTRKSGKFDGFWCSQSDASTLESTHAPQDVTNQLTYSTSILQRVQDTVDGPTSIRAFQIDW